MLTPGEIDRGGKLWVKQAQEERFPEEMKGLVVGKELGVLRVGGRLDRAELPYDAAHPIILPKKQLIVADVHNLCRHAHWGQSRASSGTKSILGHRWS